MSRIASAAHEMRSEFNSFRSRRRLRTETLTNIAGQLTTLRQEVADLQSEIDELRGDSRRVAELRILVEDELLRRP